MNYDQYNKEIQAEKKANLQASMEVFSEAADLAFNNNWLLVAKSNFHFQLKQLDGRALYNIYPSNQRIYVDNQHKKYSRFLKLPLEWTLLDVVKKVIELRKQG